MAGIEVLAGVSIPYKQNKDSKKWSGTVTHEWDLESQHVIDFASEADKKIRKKVKNHGKFPYPLKPKSLPSELEKHLKDEEKVSFTDFVEKVQINNGISLKSSRVQSKLVLIFLKYKKPSQKHTEEAPDYRSFFLIMLLKDKSALKFDEDGSPNETNIIDFEDVMQAATFSMDEFQDSLDEEDSPDVSFINGARNYFIEFLDAEDVIKNKESVKNLLSALESYSSELKLKRSERERCDSKVKAFIDDNERKGFPTKLQDVSSLLYNSLKTNRNIEIERDSFEDYIREYDFKINDEFTVSKSDREQLEFISFDTDVGNLKLKKSLIKSFGDEGDIIFNSNTGELTIKTKINDQEVKQQLHRIQKDD